MVSHQHKCIFIHIPKTAGTSIEQKLGHFTELKDGVQDHLTIRNLEPLPAAKLLKNTRMDALLPVKEVVKKMKGVRRLPEAVYRSYYKFTVVRNPWARVFSWYKNVLRSDLHRVRYHVAEDCSFEEFLENHLDCWELEPQLYWLTDYGGTIPLDYICRF
jgi:hypothetical protein